MRRLGSVPLLFLIAWVAGCAGGAGPYIPDVAAVRENPPTPLSAQTTQDSYYHIMVAEVAQKRGDLATAIRHYHHAALLSKDPQVAQRATAIALKEPDNPYTLRTATLWVELAPENPQAHRVVAALYLKNKHLPQAMQHLQLLLNLGEKQKKGSGYQLVTTILSRHEDRQGALKVMERIIGARDSEPEALFSLASLAFQAGKHAMAVERSRTALVKKPGWPPAWHLYVRAMGKQNQADTALSELERALRQEPGNLQLRVVYARTLLQFEKFDATEAEFSRLLQERPDDAEFLYPLALLALQSKREESARSYLLRLIKLGKHLDESNYYLGQLDEAAGNFDAARQWYMRVRGSHHWIEAQVRVAVLGAKQGDMPGARSYLQRLRAARREHAVRLYLVEGDLLREAEDYAAQMEVFNAALGEFPENADLRYARALTAEKLDQLNLLESDLRTVIQQDPNNSAALNALGYTLADRTTRYEEALELIQKALELDPDDPAIVDSMGWILYRLGRLDEAIIHLRRALDMGKDTEIAAHLGEVLWASGEKEKAQAVWRKALESDPEAAVIERVMKRFPQ